MLALQEHDVHDGTAAAATLSGVLDRGDAATFTRILKHLLAAGGPVVLEVSGLRVAFAPATRAITHALLAAGGWPRTSLVLVGADHRLTEALRSSGAARDVVLADDTAAVAGRIGARPERVRRRTFLAPTPTGGRRARTFLTGLGRAWDVPRLAAHAQPVAAALISNAAHHARTSSLFSVALDADGMYVAVRDFNRSLGTPSLLDPDGRRGGLGTVTRLSRDWGVTPRGDGKTVWALLVPRA